MRPLPAHPRLPCMCAQVPWAKLGQEPVVAEFDRLYIVACPREDNAPTGGGGAAAWKDPQQAEAAALKAEQEDKQRRVAAAEQAWIKVGVHLCTMFSNLHACLILRAYM